MSVTIQIPASAPARRYPYKAFISYHHASDQELARELRRALERIGKPFYRVRSFKVFLDQASLGATAEGAHTLNTALDESEVLILLASPGAAQSRWVGDELTYWFDIHPDAARRLLIVHTGGTILRGADASDFDWDKTDALPKALAGKLTETPIWVDMTWAHERDAIQRNKERFQDNVARLASPLHGRSKDELVGEDVRQLGRLKMTIGSVVTGFVALMAFLGFLSWQNAQKEAQAAANRLAFLSESLRSQDIVQSAGKALEASRKSQTDTTFGALLNAYYHMDEGWLVWRRNLGKKSANTVSFSETGEHLLVASKDAVSVMGLDGSVKTLGLAGVTDIVGAFYRPGSTEQILVGHGQKASLWTLREGVGAPIWTLDDHPDDLESVSFSGNGERLLVAYSGGRVRVLSTTRKEQLGDWNAYRAAALSFDGNLVALSSKDKEVWLESADPSKGALAGTKYEHPGEIRRLAFSPDGKYLAVAFGESGLRLWSLAEQKLDGFRSLEGHVQGIRSLQFSADSSLLVSASDDNSAMVWRAFVSTSEGSPTAWELSQGRHAKSALRKRLHHRSDPTTQEPQRRGPPGRNRTNLLDFASFSPNSDTVATALMDGSVALWFLGGDVTRARRFPDSIQQSAYLPRAGLIASAAANGRVYVWNTKEARTEALDVGSRAECVASSPDESRIVIGTDTGWLSSWKRDDKGAFQQAGKTQAHQEKISSCVISPDGKTILTTGLDGQVLLWENLDTPRQLRAFVYEGDHGKIWTGQFSHDGKRIIMGGDLGQVHIFDLSGKLTLTLPAKGQILAASFDSKDERMLTVNGSGVSDAQVWSQEGKLLALLTVPVDEQLLGAIFSKDDDWMIGSSMSGQVRVWDISAPNVSGRLLLQWQAHNDWINHLALSPNKDFLLTSALDGTVREWPISVAEIQNRLAARLAAVPAPLP